jgi:RimJ/RimL family protein N-acetyltransferase
MGTLIDTPRLALRELTDDDAPFMLELLNEPGWIRFIGDRGVRDVEGALQYLRKGPMPMYREHGFGLYAVMRKADGEPLGVCGLIKRAGLDDVDLGFALLARHERQGYGIEAARAVLAHAEHGLGIARVVAITTVDNVASMRLLERIGMRFEGMVQLPGDDEALRLFATPSPAKAPGVMMTAVQAPR